VSHEGEWSSSLWFFNVNLTVASLDPETTLVTCEISVTGHEKSRPTSAGVSGWWIAPPFSSDSYGCPIPVDPRFSGQSPWLRLPAQEVEELRLQVCPSWRFQLWPEDFWLANHGVHWLECLIGQADGRFVESLVRSDRSC
jgi:hypothetical protein